MYWKRDKKKETGSDKTHFKKTRRNIIKNRYVPIYKWGHPWYKEVEEDRWALEGMIHRELKRAEMTRQ